MAVKEKKKDLLFQILSWLILVGVFTLLAYFVVTRIDQNIDSDMASEMILAKLLLEERKILTTSWTYSTEIRILYIQLFYEFFFLFTKSWHAVRVLSTVSLYIFYLLCYHYLCRKLGCTKYFALTGALLLIPLSADYFNYVLKAPCYIPFIGISFVTIALMEDFMDHKKGLRLLFLFLNCLLALLAGMSGARQLMAIHLPLAAAAALEFLFAFLPRAAEKTAEAEANAGTGVAPVKVKPSEWLGEKAGTAFLRMVGAVLVCFFGVVGYGINVKVFSWVYYYESYRDLTYHYFNLWGLVNAIAGINTNFGFTDAELVSIGSIRNLLAFAMIAVIAVCVGTALKSKKLAKAKPLAWILIAAVVFHLILFTFTFMDYENRYWNIVLILYVPLFAVVCANGPIRGKILDALAVIAVAGVCFFACLSYRESFTVDKTAELRAIGDVLVEGSYTEGYATFWNGNVLTELTDGFCEVRTFAQESSGDELVNCYDVNHIYDWLNKRSQLTTTPAGKVFMLVTRDEQSKITWGSYLTPDHLIAETENYLVYGYESYEEMIGIFTYWDFDYTAGKWQFSCEDSDGVRTIHPGGVSFGPYITLYPGEYRVTIEGDKVDQIALASTSTFLPIIGTNAMRQSIYGDPVVSRLGEEKVLMTNEKCEYKITVSDVGSNSEICLYNYLQEDITLTRVTIERIGPLQ